MKKEKTIAFRLDANEKVASGHMIRCISIAKECIKAGNKCIFFLSENSITEPLEAEGLPYVRLGLKWDDWDYKTERLVEALKECSADYLVVDSYLVTIGFFKEMAKEIRVLYIDDLCKERYEVDSILHYSEWEDEGTISDLYKGTDVKVFLGLEYVPLREEFRDINSCLERKYDLLITTGGADKYHLTKGLLEKILDNPGLRKLSLCVVCGMMNTDYDEIVKMSSRKEKIDVFRNVKNMSELMQKSKYAVTAGGTTVYELMASCTPFVIFSFSDDQTILGERLEKNGNSIFAGDMRRDGNAVIDKIIEQIEIFMKADKQEIDRVIAKNRNAIDGKGSERIAEIINML